MQSNSESGGVEVFDPRGDLRLIVGTDPDQVAFQVCSRALARSSPYWETMLYGPFVEGQAQQQEESEWATRLPDDRPEGLRILCCAVHGRFDALPGEISQDELIDLTVLAEKYDMIGSLKPFWKDWVKNPDYVTQNASSGKELLDYLSVCYKLGYGRGFRKAFVYFVEFTAAHDDGRLYLERFSEHDLYAANYPWPLDKVLEDLERGRKTVLKAICTKIQRAMLSLIFETKCTTGEKKCNDAMLGALVRALASRQLDGWFCRRMEGVEESVTRSVSNVSSLLSELREETIAARYCGSYDWEYNLESSEPCSPWGSDDENIGDEGMDAIYEIIREYVEHLEKEAKQSGLNPERFSA